MRGSNSDGAKNRRLACFAPNISDSFCLRLARDPDFGLNRQDRKIVISCLVVILPFRPFLQLRNRLGYRNRHLLRPAHDTLPLHLSFTTVRSPTHRFGIDFFYQIDRVLFVICLKSHFQLRFVTSVLAPVVASPRRAAVGAEARVRAVSQRPRRHAAAQRTSC